VAVPPTVTTVPSGKARAWAMDTTCRDVSAAWAGSAAPTDTSAMTNTEEIPRGDQRMPNPFRPCR
jgi:hypothetical protein